MSDSDVRKRHILFGPININDEVPVVGIGMG